MPNEFQHASFLELGLGVLLGSLIVSVLLALPLKLTAESIFKYPVRIVDSVKALFAAYFTLTTLIIALVKLGAVDVARSGSIALQIIGLAVGLVILAFAIAAFIRAPDGKRPDFAQSGVVAAIMQVMSLLIAVVLTTLDLPMNGRP
ncbi:hypothetical protein sos41_19070 [Alphaproteobacteria bacterium SO-S41]|nr:hypothetical protein sos41_19070 [Alphaproteobacteria bacterium SO-S41]